MPIVAIEGPDKCGKSTMFKELQPLLWWPMHPVFVDPVSYGRDRMHIAAELSLRELEMWEALYRSNTLYVCNRHVLITDAVYSRLYKRPSLRDSRLSNSIFVVYIDVDIEELRWRHADCGEDIQDPTRYNEVKRLYEQAISRYRHLVVTPDTSPSDVLQLLRDVLCPDSLFSTRVL